MNKLYSNKSRNGHCFDLKLVINEVERINSSKKNEKKLKMTDTSKLSAF